MLKIENLHKSFGGVSAMNGVSLNFPESSLTAVIGPNGAGKTTLFNLITGAFRPDSGRVLLAGDDIAGLSAPEIVERGIGRAFQIASIFPTLTVREAILGAVHAHRHRHVRLGHHFPLRETESQADEVMELVKQAFLLLRGDNKLQGESLGLGMRLKRNWRSVNSELRKLHHHSWIDVTYCDGGSFRTRLL